MINLTYLAHLLYNGVDIIPYIMGGRQLVFGAALAAGLGAATEQVKAQDNTILAEAKSPSVGAAMQEYKDCIDRATSVTTPAMIPDASVRGVAFDTLAELCDDTLQARLESHAAKQEAAELTRSIIEGAKREVGLKS